MVKLTIKIGKELKLEGPLGAGTDSEGFIEDYAVVESTAGSKIEEVHMGNVIDLGTEIQAYKFTMKMHPRTNAPTTVKYPADDCLLKLRDLIEEDHMHILGMLDHGDGQPCLWVIKKYFSNGTHQSSMEWVILPCDSKSGVFSAPGDSGSIIADGCGSIGGLLTGGTGLMESLDVIYAKPLFWFLPRIKSNGFPDGPTSTQSWARVGR